MKRLERRRRRRQQDERNYIRHFEWLLEQRDQTVERLRARRDRWPEKKEDST